jgi:hypothetical protein
MEAWIANEIGITTDLNILSIAESIHRMHHIIIHKTRITSVMSRTLLMFVSKCIDSYVILHAEFGHRDICVLSLVFHELKVLERYWVFICARLAAKCTYVSVRWWKSSFWRALWRWQRQQWWRLFPIVLSRMWIRVSYAKWESRRMSKHLWRWYHCRDGSMRWWQSKIQRWL